MDKDLDPSNPMFWVAMAGPVVMLGIAACICLCKVRRGDGPPSCCCPPQQEDGDNDASLARVNSGCSLC
jgi:hypothetical protein